MIPVQQFDKYARLGDYHWRMTYPSGWRRSSPPAHARYDVVLNLVSDMVDMEATVGLDVGCGDGVMLYKIALRGGRAMGVDVSWDGLPLAQEHFRQLCRDNPWLVQGSAYELPLESESVNYVTAVEVVEHLKAPEMFLREVIRLLRPGGIFALTTPQKSGDRQVHDAFHEREYDAHELSGLLKSYFGEVHVWGQFPTVLNRLYFRPTGMRPLDQCVTALFKSASLFGYNPFTRWVTSRPTQRWEGLVATCRKSPNK
jgi:ubiquinone/menaquinone biosynthesis C-methylase UbiE